MPHDYLVTAGACTVHFSDPMLVFAWLKAVAGAITPDFFMGIYKAMHPMDGDKISATQQIVNQCIGIGI